MKKNFLCLLGIAIGSLMATGSLRADEREEIKQRIVVLLAEAQELANQGKDREAERRMKEVLEMRTRLLELSEPQADPHRAERKEREEMLHRMANRLEHMRAAAQHLKEGDMPDMAHELNRRAEELQNQLRKEKERFALDLERKSGPHERGEKMPLVVAQREKIHLVQPRQIAEQEAWGAKVKEELTRHSEVIKDVRAEQETMRRELKELRQLIERLAKPRMLSEKEAQETRRPREAADASKPK